MSEGWLLLRQEAVPARWEERAVPVALIPLLPGESSQLIVGEPIEPEIDRTDTRLLSLTARGLTITKIAADLGVSTRTVQRHLSRLGRRFGVRTKTELAGLLSERSSHSGEDRRDVAGGRHHVSQEGSADSRRFQ